MDRVRLGRVLGKGARLAARTAIEAVDAATSAPPDQPVRVDGANGTSAQRPARSVPTPTYFIPSQVKAASKAARAGALAPLREASRALWHEVTGCFFALFALSFGVGAWHTRAGARSNIPAEQHHFAAFCLLTLLFLYFSVTSFVTAHRRTQR